MKLERVALRGFLSHEATDWQPNGARLVTLVGANGAGKSSLAVDGLLYALYDDARGRTDDLVRLGSTDMSVVVEFAFAGGRYRVTRGRTTRSGGRSFLELAIADGERWRPLTAESIRETQQAIEQLLRMDAAAFETAVVLVQGESMRFADASPADRKRILGSVIGLDIWERAEVRAKEAARDVSVRCEGARLQVERLEARSDELTGAPDQVIAWQGELDTIHRAQALAITHRDEAEATMRDLAGRMATAEAAVAEVTRLEAELEAHKSRWVRADRSRTQAEDAIARADRTLEREPEVQAAVASIDGLRAAVSAVDAVHRDRRVHQDEIAHHRGEIVRLQGPYEAAVREHARTMATLRSEVDTLERMHASLQPVTCPPSCPVSCGHTFLADPADLAVSLVAARTKVQQAPPEPSVPMGIQRAEAQIVRLEERLRDLPAPAEQEERAARAALEAALRTAAAVGELEAARAAREDAARSLASAIAELDAVTAAGKAAREALTSAKERASAVVGLLERRDAQTRVIKAAAEALAALDRERSDVQARLANARAQGTELERITAEIASIREPLAADDLELRRLRRLADAFGVKGIPARIIASVLPELEGYANELLADLRPGMSLAVRAQRARKAGDGVVEALDLVVRDDAGERPLGLFSGGERMSVALAIAVALSRLVARRAGTAIRTLVVDEPDGLDADARRSFGQALRVLAHHGELERVVLVSHHADLAEFGDEVYTVTKVNGSSVVAVTA